jgi:hypothetical protein
MKAFALRAVLCAAAIVGVVQTAPGQEAPDTGPFAGADMKSASQARCEELRKATRAVEAGPTRVDLSVVGTLTFVHHDGTLAYLGLCSPPDVRVLCITYQTNGLKIGDVVMVAGGYGRPDADHIVLDPCLASQPPEPSQ